jgi:hypothetical protein
MAAPLILLGALATGSIVLQNQQLIDKETQKEEFQYKVDKSCKPPPFKTGDTILLNNKADKKALIPIPVDDIRTVDQVLRNEYIQLDRKDTRPMYGPQGGGLSISTRAKQNMYRNPARRSDVPGLQFMAEKKESQNNQRRVRERQMMYMSMGKKRIKATEKVQNQGGVKEGFDPNAGGFTAWSSPSGGKFNEFASPKLNDFEDNYKRQRTFNSDVPLSATTIFQRNKNNYVTTGLIRETPRVPVTQRGLQEEWMGLGTLDPDPENARKVLSLSKAARRTKGGSGGVQAPWASLRDKVTSREQLEFETFGGPHRKILPKYFLNQSARSRSLGEREQVITRRSKTFEYQRFPNFRLGGRQSAIVTTGMIETNRNGAGSDGTTDAYGREVEEGSNTRMPILNRLTAMHGTIPKEAVKLHGEITEFPQRGLHYEGMGKQVAPKRYFNGVSKIDRFGKDVHRYRRPCDQLDWRLHTKAVARDNIAKNRRVWFRQDIIDSENKGIGLTKPVSILPRTQM